MGKPKDSVYCISWEQAESISPKEVIKALGVYREDVDHIVIDFAQPLNYPQHETIPQLYQVFQEVASHGFRYLMVYNDNISK